jgi:hypothetical protein
MFGIGRICLAILFICVVVNAESSNKFKDAFRRKLQKSKEKTKTVAVPFTYPEFPVGKYFQNYKDNTGAFMDPNDIYGIYGGAKHKGFAANIEYCDDGKRMLMLGKGRSFCVSSKSRKLAYNFSLLTFILTWTCYYNFVGQ